MIEIPVDVLVVMQSFAPFILMFTIFFALLQKSGIFGPPEKRETRKINVVLSLMMAFLVIAYSPLRAVLAELFARLFTGTALTILALTLFVFFTLLINLAIRIKPLSIIIGIILTIFVLTVYGVPLVVPPAVPLVAEVIFVSILIGFLALVWWLFTRE